MRDLSVVVVSFGTRELLLACLASVAGEARRCGLRVETLVVDNASPDGSARAVRDRFPDARLVALPANRGFAAGCNEGLRRAAGRHVLLLNSDCRVRPGALARGVGYLDAHPDVGIAGGQCLRPDGRKQNSIHAFPTLRGELLPKGLLPLLFPGRHPSSRFAGPDPVDVEAVSGAALFARREVVERVGPLPRDYFFFLEETDWCEQVRRAGWRVVHLPDARFTHAAGASSKRVHPARTRIEFHRSLYTFFEKRRGPRIAAAVRGIRLAKSAFYVASQAPLALLSEPLRRRWRVHRAVVRWHLRGRPVAAGLAAAAAREGDA